MKISHPKIAKLWALIVTRTIGVLSVPLMHQPSRAPLADSVFAQLPVVLKLFLKKVARRLFFRSLIQGLCWLSGILLVLLALQALLDWFFEFPISFRAILLCLDAGVAFFMVWLFVFLPTRPDFEDCALEVERRFPEFQSSLISAVQFSKGASTPALEKLFQRVEAIVSELRMDEVVSFAPLRRPAGIVALILGTLIVVAAICWPTSKALLARLVLSKNSLPAETLITSVTSANSLGAGESLDVQVRATGALPHFGIIEILRPGFSPIRTQLQPVPDTPGAYTTTISNVQESFSYRVLLKRASSDWRSVDVSRPPSIASIQMVQHFPSYTERPPENVDTARLDLFAGGRLEISGTATDALRAAQVEIKGKSPLPLAIFGKDFKGSLPIPASGLDAFSIAVENSQGVSSSQNTVYQVRIISDAPPKVTWSPGGYERRSVTSDFKPRLAFSVSDDRLLTGVDLVAKVGPGEPPPVRVPLNLPAPGRAYEFDEILGQPGAFFPWEAGHVVTYWIEARDNNNVTGPGVGKSSTRELTIITRDQKRAEIEKRLEQNARRIKDLSESQKNLRQSVEKLLQP